MSKMLKIAKRMEDRMNQSQKTAFREAFESLNLSTVNYFRSHGRGDQERVRCPRCGRVYDDKVDVEFIKDVGFCLMCDKLSHEEWEELAMEARKEGER